MAIEGKTRRNAALGIALAASGAAAIAIAARRDRISIRGWLVSRVVLPVIYGQPEDNFAKLALRIVDNRADGPALPSKRTLRNKFFADEVWDGTRVYRLAPQSGPRSALRVLYIHGGAYVFDLMAMHWSLISGLVDRTEAEVVSAIYPLAPERGAEDGLQAVGTIFDRMATDVGAEHIVIVGDSAGGGLALALVQRLCSSGTARPAGLVLFYPWLDVTCSGNDQEAMAKTEPLLSLKELREAGRMWAQGSDPASPPASPLYGDLTVLPPTLALVGTRDLLLSDSLRLKERQPAVEVVEYPGMFHGWACAPIPEARQALDQAAAFIHQLELA